MAATLRVTMLAAVSVVALELVASRMIVLVVGVLSVLPVFARGNTVASPFCAAACVLVVGLWLLALVAGGLLSSGWPIETTSFGAVVARGGAAVAGVILVPGGCWIVFGGGTASAKSAPCSTDFCGACDRGEGSGECTASGAGFGETVRASGAGFGESVRATGVLRDVSAM